MLDLRNNCLSGLDEMIFKGLANLKFVYLGNNHLELYSEAPDGRTDGRTDG